MVSGVMDGVHAEMVARVAIRPHGAFASRIDAAQSTENEADIAPSVPETPNGNGRRDCRLSHITLVLLSIADGADVECAG